MPCWSVGTANARVRSQSYAAIAVGAATARSTPCDAWRRYASRTQPGARRFAIANAVRPSRAVIRVPRGAAAYPRSTSSGCMSVGSPRPGAHPVQREDDDPRVRSRCLDDPADRRVDGAEHVDQRPVAGGAAAEVREQRMVGLDGVPQQVRRVVRLCERDQREVRREPADQAARESPRRRAPSQDSFESATSERLDGLSCDGGRSSR